MVPYKNCADTVKVLDSDNDPGKWRKLTIVQIAPLFILKMLKSKIKLRKFAFFFKFVKLLIILRLDRRMLNFRMRNGKSKCYLKDSWGIFFLYINYSRIKSLFRLVFFFKAINKLYLNLKKKQIYD